MKVFLVPLLVFGVQGALDIPQCSKICFETAGSQRGCNVPVEYSCICSQSGLSMDFYQCISVLCSETYEQFARDIVQRQCSMTVSTTSTSITSSLWPNATASSVSSSSTTATSSSSSSLSSQSTLTTSPSLSSSSPSRSVNSTTQGFHARPTEITATVLMTETITAPSSIHTDDDLEAEVDNSGLSTGAKIAIGALAPVATLIIGFIAIYYVKRKKGAQQGVQYPQEEVQGGMRNPPMGYRPYEHGVPAAELNCHYGYTFNLPEIDGSKIGDVRAKAGGM